MPKGKRTPAGCYWHDCQDRPTTRIHFADKTSHLYCDVHAGKITQLAAKPRSRLAGVVRVEVLDG